MSELLEKIKNEAEQAKNAQIEASKIKDEIRDMKKQIKSIVSDSENWTKNAIELMQSSVDTMLNIKENFGCESLEIASVKHESVNYKFVISACFASAFLSAALTALTVFLLI